MSNRREHNLSVKLAAPNIDENLVDDTNYFMDFPSQIYGSQHRKYFGHNPNPMAPDSILVNRMNPQREFARQFHLAVDGNKNMQKMLLMLSVLNGDNIPADRNKKIMQIMMVYLMTRL